MTTEEEKKEKRINKNLKIWITNERFFGKKYLHNILVDFCHPQSTQARTAFCNICHKGVSAKELKKMTGYSYGFVFGQFENKRHRREEGHPHYFGPIVCKECCEKVEKLLDYSFQKSYAP